uniref:Anaphase-promoting complex subunit 4-like WD40 domain-containing protein n=1 Tax=Xenopus tropicalis TaxID=8364 RepID=A0A6I8R0W8_XENTR
MCPDPYSPSLYPACSPAAVVLQLPIITFSVLDLCCNGMWIAAAQTTNGVFPIQVLLHQLANIQRVWSLPPSENTGKEVKYLAWRSDGKSNLTVFV